MDDLFSPIHLLIVLVIALLVFGPKRLPELGQGLGRSIREFRNATAGLTGGAGDAQGGTSPQVSGITVAEPSPPLPTADPRVTTPAQQDGPPTVGS